jgi:hypothetical protein
VGEQLLAESEVLGHSIGPAAEKSTVAACSAKYASESSSSSGGSAAYRLVWLKEFLEISVSAWT